MWVKMNKALQSVGSRRTEEILREELLGLGRRLTVESKKR